SVDELGFGSATADGGRLPGVPAVVGTILTVTCATGTDERAEELTRRYPEAGAGGLADRDGAGRAHRGGPADRGRTPGVLTIAFSPCPNDTFIFHAWTHGLIAGAPELTVSYADIDQTNGWLADERGLDVMKISAAALPEARANGYELLPCGGAMGRGCGPLVLAAPGFGGGLAGRTVAVPSLRSTAFLLFRQWAAARGEQPEIKVMRFRDIMPAVRDGEVDAGLVIHEAR